MSQPRASSDPLGVLVVGTGSVGLRHIRNLLALGAQVTAYSYRRASGSFAPPLPSGVALASSLDDALARPIDAVVIANRTDEHVPVALSAAARARNLFIEKPLSNALDGLSTLARYVHGQQLVVEAGFMLRCHPNVRWMREYAETGALGAIRYVRAAVGQHLSDWRPGTDHRASYSAKRGCGGVIFDLIHELDLIRWFAGTIEEVSAIIADEPSLQIDSEAIAEITMRCSHGVMAQAHLDCVRPVYARMLEIVGADAVMTWDYSAGTVVVTARGSTPVVMHQVPDGFDRNDMFIAHMRHFLARLQDPTLLPLSSLDEGIEALRVALAAHASARGRRIIRLSDSHESLAPAAP